MVHTALSVPIQNSYGTFNPQLPLSNAQADFSHEMHSVTSVMSRAHVEAPGDVARAAACIQN